MITLQELPVKIDEHEYKRFAAFDGSKYIGTCDVRHRGTVATFRQLFVLPQYRRQGVGRLLLMAVQKAAFVWGCTFTACQCRVGNIPALKFYQAQGYEIDERDGDDWVMVRPVGPKGETTVTDKEAA